MNDLQRLRADREYLLTLNREDAIDPAAVIGRPTYEQPVCTLEGMRTQGEYPRIGGTRRTHCCGAYWSWGFHEDGLRSALRACRGIASSPVRSRFEPLSEPNLDRGTVV